MINVVTDAALVSEVELKFSGKGKAYTRLRVVSKERKRDMQGNWVDGDESFFNVTVFGKMAEMLIESNPAKGTRLNITGKGKLEKWTDKDGKERESFAVVADTIGLDLTFTAYTKIGREAAARGTAAKANEVSGDGDIW